MTPTRLVWLFDVDGTLLLTGGAAHEAFVRAVGELLGVDDELRDVAFAGRTEPLILGDILHKHGKTFVDGEEARFWNSVFGHMRAVLVPGRGAVLPGVPELLDAVEAEPGWEAALLTGNMTEMARIKLTHYGLGHRFGFGAFGEEAADRNALACVAVARARERHGVSATRCVVVGDTEHDVACARAAGAHVIAVATGGTSRDVLEALGPDLVLDDLTDTERIVGWARGVAASG